MIEKTYMIPVTVKVSPKKKNITNASFGGRLTVSDDETQEKIADLWNCHEGFRAYFEDHKNVTVHMNTLEAEETLTDLIHKDLKDGVFKPIEEEGAKLDEN